MSHATVRLEIRLGEKWLVLDGGDPKGGDTFHRTVSAWAGWQRRPITAANEGAACSRYEARAWLAALQPLVRAGMPLNWTPEAKAWADAQVAAYARREHALSLKAGHETFGGRSTMPHQTQAVLALAEMGQGAGLRDDMGLGKTTSAIFAWHRSSARRVLVICPKSVKLNWLAEVEACFGASVNDLRTYLIDGTPSHRNAVLGFMRHVATTDEARGIAVVNYDLLRSMSEQAWKSLELWVAGQCVIADEFHYCKDLSAKRTQSVRHLMKLADLRLGLTGTPVRNTVEDLFAQIELLRPGTWVSYHDFANRHLVISQVQLPGRKFKTAIVRGGKNLEELNRVVNTIWIGRKKEEVLTLPPLIRTKPRLELDGVHLDVYKAMKRFARVELEKLVTVPSELDPFTAVEPDNTKTWPVSADVSMWHPLARSAVEAAMRCEMIAQGFLSGLPDLYTEEIAPLLAGKAERVEGYPNAFVFPDSPKMAWVLETIEQDLKDRQVVVLSRFNAPIIWMKKRLEKCALLIGAMDAVERHETINAFRKGVHRVLCVQVKMAEGFNLTESQDVIFLGRDWADAINKQAEARCHRIGTQGTVNVQIPIVENTIEKFIDKKLAAKESDAQQALKSVTLKELMDAL